MLKFMLLDLFSFRFVGSKPKIMQMMTIMNILIIMKIIKVIKTVIMDLYYWRSHFLTFSIGALYLFDIFHYSPN